jgi:hypothetical protein
MAKIGVLDKQLAHILRQHRTVNLDGVTQSDILWSLQMETVDLIKKEVERRKIKPGELSLMAGISYWKVYHTLAGHSGHEDVIRRLAKVLGVQVAA